MNNCIHESACWLPPDFRPDRYRCNQCGYQSETIEQMAENGNSNRERLEAEDKKGEDNGQ